MIPTRYFAGRAPVTPPTSDSESDSKSSSDAEPVRRTPVPRRRRFVARVVAKSGQEEQTQTETPKPGRGFVPLKELQQAEVLRIQTPPLDSASLAPGPSREPNKPPSPSPSPASNSSESESCSESERSPSPEPQPPLKPSFKPVFIKPKPKEAPDDSRKESRALERKEEARELVFEVLKEEEASKRIAGDVELPDDADREGDRPREEALWRVREMRRVVREREEEKAWRNRGMATEEVESGEDGVLGGVGKPGDESGKNSSDTRNIVEAGRVVKAGPFFQETGADGKFTEEIYNRELHEGRGGIPSLRVGRDGGRSGQTKFAGLAKEDTAAEMERELRRDRELAAIVEAARR